MAWLLASACLFAGGSGSGARKEPASAEDSVHSFPAETTDALRFVENQGQWPGQPCYVASDDEYAVGVLPDRILLRLHSSPGDASAGVVIALVFEGARRARLLGSGLAPGLHSYFRGSDPAGWRSDVRAFRRVLMEDLYEGIDLVLREGAQGLEYDLVVAPGVDLEQVVVRCEGVEGLSVDAQGRLTLVSSIGELLQDPATSWEETGTGTSKAIEVPFRQIDSTRFGFEAPERDPDATLVVDPGLVWSTFVGGAARGGASVGDQARAVALDGNGHVTVVGTSEGPEFPMTVGTYQSPDPLQEDIFVMKFRQSDGQLIYSSLIGGSTHEDRAYDVAVDAGGRATVTGWTFSKDFPTTPGALDTFMDGSITTFILRLNATGQQLEYSTFLEGSNGSAAYTVGLAADGSAIVAGEAYSPDFPTTPGAFQESYVPSSFSLTEAFVGRLDPTGSSLTWSTFLGGTGTDSIYDLVLDDQERVTVVGHMNSSNFPTTPGAFMETFAGSDAFVSRFSSDGTQLIWSTLLGGPGDVTKAWAVALDRSGSVVVAGQTGSLGFPVTPGAFQTVYSQGPFSKLNEAFITRLDPTGSFLEFSTFLGGTGSEQIDGLTVDGSGLVTVAGYTDGPLFPTTPGSFDPTGSGRDAFLSRLSPDGSTLYYSTQVGGWLEDRAEDLVCDAHGRATFVGRAFSANYPTTPGSFSPIYNGGQMDGVVTTMDLYLQGVEPVGASSSSCLGPLVINATTMPLAGQPFGLYCSQAPPDAQGLLLAFLGEGAPTLQLVQSDEQGFVETPVGNLPNTPGKVLRYRYAFRNTPTCPGQGALSFSNLVVVQVQ